MEFVARLQSDDLRVGIVCYSIASGRYCMSMSLDCVCVLFSFVITDGVFSAIYRRSLDAKINVV